MTLRTSHIDAGWHEVDAPAGRRAAERYLSRPGASSSTLRVEADTQNGLWAAIDLRESQLVGATEEIKDTITDDGTLVTGAQHESLRVEGVTVGDRTLISVPVLNEDEVKQVADFDASEGVVNAPQGPADAADQAVVTEGQQTTNEE